MSYTAKGTVKVLSDTVKISDSFKKRTIVIEDNSDQYPQVIEFQAVQDNCLKLDSINVGDSVEISFNLRGREWTSPKDGTVRYFNTLDLWKVDKIGATQQAETFVDEGDEDLPF